MSRILTPLLLEPLDVQWVDRKNWKVLEAFEFASQVLERIVVVPRGFVTDFASTPRILWTVFPPTGQYTKAACLHDYLYRTTTQECTRLEADRTFLEAMVALKVPRFTRWLMFLGVRMGGHSSFKARTYGHEYGPYRMYGSS